MGPTKITTQIKSITLISAPWPLFNRPSIQLGALKSYLSQEIPDLQVTTHHFYLKLAAAIGYPLYREICEKTWLAESVYAALLYPARFDRIQTLFYREAKGKPLSLKVDFKALTRQAADAADEFISSINWDRFGLAGFSLCLCQLTSSLYFIRAIKRKYPELAMVIGGSMFAGDTAKDIFRVFPEIDFVINGEGELPLCSLVRHLKNNADPEKISRIPGLVSPHSCSRQDSLTFNQMADLKDLPVPDYDDYFHLMKTQAAGHHFFPTLPAEASRGGRWQASRSGHSGCAFCNLNRNWQGYRCKSPEQVCLEIDHLTSKYRTLSVMFMDNLIPAKTARKMFDQLSGLEKDLNLFCELRATTPKRVLEKMGAAGVTKVQIGIESLSSRLLKKLNKGTTAIQNLEIMKHCEGLGIANTANLILHFPGSDLEDMNETLRNLEFAAFFRPPKLVHFWLGHGSRVYADPDSFGVKAKFNHPNYAKIFPKEIHRHMTFLIQRYRGDMGYQKKLWQPVKQKVNNWEKTYTQIHRAGGDTPILSYRDGRDFMIIRQKRLLKPPLTHRLEGVSRKVYLYCGQHRSLGSICHHFQGMTQERVMPFLKMMTDKKLMFEENNKYLSLAVPLQGVQGS
ncbi:MAG: RiPP maturation radical SAM protein 1 [Desulfobacter sp.]|nr:RiPP maturation radical SAM protein 1 [Desulfobacter sp.]